MSTRGADARRWHPLALAGWCALFVVAATLNAGGYRYGASDQAFYIPAVLRHLDAALFPRDWALLGPQDHFNFFTPGVAAIARATGWTLPSLFAGLYLIGLLALFAAAWGIGSHLYRSRWTIVALLFAFSLRHAVALGAVNTLEGYMHPRMLAFGAGGLAVAACLQRRPLLAVLFVSAALLLHPTTAIWFALWVGVAFAVCDRRLRLPAMAAVLLAAAAGAWALIAGPLAGRLVPMDDAWLSVLGPKKYLFPTEWPASAWFLAAIYPVVIASVYWLRRTRAHASHTTAATNGCTTDAPGTTHATDVPFDDSLLPERGLVIGAAALVAVFLASLPFTAARLAMAVQLQVGRVLWLLDLLAVSYAVWYLAEGAPWAKRHRRAAACGLALVLVTASVGRGAYVMFVEHPDRPVVQVHLPADAWNQAMRWIQANTAKDAWVLAAPGHAWRYGTSVRLAAQRDVYLEEAKDTAMAMYSRDAARSVLDRIGRAGNVDRLTGAEAQALAAATGLDILVTEQRLALPLLYRNGRFSVYRLR